MNVSSSAVENSSKWVMACLAYAQPNYHQYGLLLRFLESVSTPNGIAISSAIHGCAISNFLSDQFPDRYFQFVPERRQDIACFAWGNAYPYAGFGDVPVSLADRNTEVSSVPHPFVGSGVVLSRLRRLDSLYVDSKQPVKILHIAESPARVLDILAGGHALLMRDQPTLIFEVRSSDNITNFACGLEALNYLLLDSSLLTVIDSKNHDIHPAAESETCFLGLPKAFVHQNGLATSLWPRDSHLANHPDWQHALIAGLTREARYGGIRFGSLPPTRYHYSFNDQLLCDNFYPTEYQDGHEWRWLGPKTSARVWLPTPRIGIYRLELTVLGESQGSLIQGTRLFLDGTLLTLFTETIDGHTKLVATIEIPVEQERQQIELLIAVPSTHRTSSDDPRLLGICLTVIDFVRVKQRD